MNYYLAPLEGITGYVFRKCLKEVFGEGIDKYFSPFLVPHEKKPMSSKEINEINPENNQDINLVPQILTNDATDFLRLEKALHDFGYNTVNLNLGCPSKTVAGKGRGSGFLGKTGELDRFLYEIYESKIGDISIKTRIGEKSTDEYERLIEIYNKYPVSELIVHPRIRYEYYNGIPHQDIFKQICEMSVNPVCYNGDINSLEDYERLLDYCGEDKLNSVMIGRGVLRNPSLIRELSGGSRASIEEIKDFLRNLRNSYSEVFDGETPVLQKMKEIWSYMQDSFPDKYKDCKALLKCRSIAEYRILEQKILR